MGSVLTLTATGSDVAVLPGRRAPLPGAVLVGEGFLVLPMDALHSTGLEAAATRRCTRPPREHLPVHIAHLRRAVPHG